MEDKRQFKRRHLIFYLQVFDQKNDELIGYLVDITHEGIMLISESPIEKDKAFKLKMTLPSRIGKKSHITFDAKSVWSRKDVNSDYYDTGFQIQGMPMENIQLFDELVSSFGFKE